MALYIMIVFEERQPKLSLLMTLGDTMLTILHPANRLAQACRHLMHCFIGNL